MNTHGLVFLKHTMGTQLGQPDVEDVMALCLTGRRGEREKMTPCIEKEERG